MDDHPEVEPGPKARFRDHFRSIAIDIAPLRNHRDFRLLWFAAMVSSIGSNVSFVAIAFQVYAITGSPLAVGLIGLVELVPLLTLPFLGGALADAMDRKRLLITTEAIGGLCAAGLALNASLSDPKLWVIYALTVGMAATYALGSPAQRSATPLLVPAESLTSAAAINSSYYNFSAIVGPAIGGISIAAIGLASTYLVDALSFFVAIALIVRIAPMPRPADADRVSMRSIFDGIRFLKNRPVLQGSFLVDINAMVFGMPEALFPAFAEMLGGGPRMLGLMYAAPSFGALIASLTSGWTRRVRKQGLVIYGAVICWGAALVVFGISRILWLTLAALVAAGAADMISAVFRTTILQRAAPPEMLGRLHGLELAVVASGPSVGNLEAGLLAALTSVRFSTVFGGVACIAGVGLMASLLPQFARYDATNPTP